MKEYSGKDVDEILEEIAADNRCKKEEIVYKVLDESKHLLGIGNKITLEAFTPQDVKDFIFDYLGAYFMELNQGVAIEIFVEKDKDNGETLYRTVLDADNNAIIIGKNGQTLRAISIVLKAAVNATFKHRVNVIIDINHYKEDRYRKVKGLANRIAKEVVKTKVDVELDPMPSDERKVIHQFLQGRKNIETISIDEGSKRHLVIKYKAEEGQEEPQAQEEVKENQDINQEENNESL